MSIDQRGVSTTLTGTQWGALDRWREAHGHATIADALRAIITSATDDLDQALYSAASQMGDPRPLLNLTRSSLDHPHDPNQ